MALATYLLAVVTVQLLTVWTTVRPETVGVTCEAADQCKETFVKAASDANNYFDRYCELMETKIWCYRNVINSCPVDTRPYAQSDLDRDTREYRMKCSAPFVSRTSWIVLSLAVLAALSSRHV